MRNEFDRFIEKVNKTDTCWEWTAGKYRGGYGHFRKKVGDKWKMYKAHRYSYEYFKGPIEKGLLICHSCDNTSCVNPDHLFSGTAAENTLDMRKKGRCGKPTHPWGKNLTKVIADQIRQDHRNGMKYVEIQKKYDVSKQQVSRIILNKIWK